MKIGTRIAAAGLLSLAATTSGLVAGAGTAVAQTTGNNGASIGWQPDTNDLGGLYFYDASGHQITSGSINDVPMAKYYVAATGAAASGHVSTTTPEKSNSATWNGTNQITSDQSFPAATLPGDLAGFTGGVVSDDSGASFQQNQIASFPNNFTVGTDPAYANLYEVRMYAPGTATKWFAADIQVSGSTWTQVFPNQAAPTVTLSLGSGETNPTSTNATYHVVATLSQALAGTVQFKDNGTNVGSPVVVSGSTATLSQTPSAAGSHSYTATFIPQPGTSGLGASTTQALAHTVNPPAVQTTIAFVSQSVGSNANDPASFTFHVSAADSTHPTGSVQFKDGTTVLGNGTESGATGDWTYGPTSALGQGSHQITAQFLSSDTTKYGDSNVASGPAFNYAASPTVGPPSNSSVKLTVAPGIVTITTPYADAAHAFDLGTLALNQTATLLTKSALFPAAADNPITVTDTRAGDLPWHATLTASDFVGRASSSHTINGENFGFAPDPATYPSGNALTGKVDVSSTAPAVGVAPGDTNTAGLKGGPTFAAVHSGQSGVGTAFIRGQLSVQAPTSTVADTYDGVLTFTVIGS